MRKVFSVMLALMMVATYCCTAQATASFGFGKDATIEETILLDEYDVRITATELTYTYSGIEIELFIENNSSKDLSFHSGTMGYGCNAVNGYMVGDGYLSCDVAAGESKEDTIHISESVMTMMGISEVACIELGFDISDDDYNHFYSGPCKLYTSAHDGYDYSVNTYRNAVTDGVLQDAYNFTLEDYSVGTIVSENGVSLEAWGLFTNYAGEKQLMFECVNKSGEQIGVRTYRAGLNGLMLYESYTTYDTVNPGCTQIISFPYEYLVEDAYRNTLGLGEVGTVSFTFDAVEDDYDIVVNPVELSFPVGNESASYDSAGTEVLNQDGVRVTYMGFFNGHSEYDDELHALFIVENTYGDDINFRFEDCMLNGNEVDTVGSMIVPEGTTAALELTFYSYSFEEYGIATVADVESIDANIQIRDVEYSTIFEGPIPSIPVISDNPMPTEVVEHENATAANDSSEEIDEPEVAEDDSTTAVNVEEETETASAADSEDQSNVSVVGTTVEKGTTYTYLNDKWDLYRATLASDRLMKIDCWYRAVANDENPFKLSHCIMVFDITDATTDFCWLDDEQTMFTITITDKENSRLEEPTFVIFELESAGSFPMSNDHLVIDDPADTDKTYTYIHDKWDLYRATLVADNVIKIDCWDRVVSDEEHPFELDHSVGVITTDNESTDFRWVDDAHTAFTVTIQDEENSRLEEPTFVYFELETNVLK